MNISEVLVVRVSLALELLKLLVNHKIAELRGNLPHPPSPFTIGFAFFFLVWTI